jgi:hypothetical protein
MRYAPLFLDMISPLVKVDGTLSHRDTFSNNPPRRWSGLLASTHRTEAGRDVGPHLYTRPGDPLLGDGVHDLAAIPGAVTLKPGGQVAGAADIVLGLAVGLLGVANLATEVNEIDGCGRIGHRKPQNFLHWPRGNLGG